MLAQALVRGVIGSEMLGQALVRGVIGSDVGLVLVGLGIWGNNLIAIIQTNIAIAIWYDIFPYVLYYTINTSN